jgi:hypothetical protein
VLPRVTLKALHFWHLLLSFVSLAGMPFLWPLLLTSGVFIGAATRGSVGVDEIGILMQSRTSKKEINFSRYLLPAFSRPT